MAKCSLQERAVREHSAVLLRAQLLLAQQQRDLDRPRELELRAQEARRVAEKKRRTQHLEQKAAAGKTVVKTEGNDKNFKDYKPNKKRK